MHDQVWDLVAQEHDHKALIALAGAGEMVWMGAFGLMVWLGFRHRTYAMPILGLAAHAAMAFMCGFIGPFTEPDLFPHNDDAALWMWRAYFGLNLLVMIQYGLYGHLHQHRVPLRRGYGWVAAGAFLLALVTEYTFVIYFVDYNVNEISPIIVLMIAIGYVIELTLRVDLKGLSLWVAWMVTIGTLLLYISTFPMMEDAYPGHDNYWFIFWIEALQLTIFGIYIWMLWKRKRHFTSVPAASAARGAAVA